MEQDKNQRNIDSFLVIIFGPPASGKSTLAHKLKASFRQFTLRKQLDLNCQLISADCLQEYLRTHTAKELEQELQRPQGRDILSQYKLKRSLFDEYLWKGSREFIKKNVSLWLHKWNLVILQDDLLLKSQRKQMRQLVEHTQTRYIELYFPLTFEECQLNLNKRQQLSSKEQQLAQHKLRQCFDKFQLDGNPYCFPVNRKEDICWQNIQNLCKKVLIEHPQQKQKQVVSQENVLRDSVETQIRNFISEIMRNKELRKKYFPNQEVNEVAAVLSRTKKNYIAKNKTIEGFKTFFFKETQNDSN